LLLANPIWLFAEQKILHIYLGQISPLSCLVKYLAKACLGRFSFSLFGAPASWAIGLLLTSSTFTLFCEKSLAVNQIKRGSRCLSTV
jgi:hypothetical protein